MAARSQIGGGTALVGGLAGMITLIAADGQSDTNLWCQRWFQVSFATAVLLSVCGLYIAASSYIPLPIPRTLEERRGNQGKYWLNEEIDYAGRVLDEVRDMSNAEWYQQRANYRILDELEQWEARASAELRKRIGPNAAARFMRGPDGGTDTFSHHDEPLEIVAYIKRRVAALKEIRDAV